MLFDHSLTVIHNTEILIEGFSQTDESYSLFNLLKKYLGNLGALWLGSYKWIIYILLFEFVYTVIYLRFKWNFLPYIKAMFIITTLSLFIYYDRFLLGDRNMHYYYVNFHFVVYCGALIFSFSRLKKDPDLKKIVLLILFSFLMLFVGSIGTNGYLTSTFLGYMPFV
jgi:peptidoglycan/LPS O-acetylase OafA/YrhL